MTGGALVLGGYGNFGKRIVRGLVRHGVRVVIAGRDARKAEAFAQTVQGFRGDAARLDIRDPAFAGQLATLSPSVVVNTCGPFQTADYGVARLCIDQQRHYVDLADGRAFVTGVTALDEDARRRNVCVISGASTVPGLSSAVVEHFRDEFSELNSVAMGISPGQKTERGLATTQAIMTYVGRPLRPFAGASGPVYGWQDIYRQAFPEIGSRWMANCDIPDLDLLPERYGLRSIRFSAGLELGVLHLGLWLLSWGVRIGLPLDLPRHAKVLLRASNLFDVFGTSDGGMFVTLAGRDHSGRALERRWFIVAGSGDGPQIPCVPAIVLAKRLLSDAPLQAGAYPCVGLVSLEDYVGELRGFDIRQQEMAAESSRA
jgi:hypothetical protein